MRRAALRVDGGRGGLEREAGLQPRGAGDVGRLHADLPDATAHDLLDLGGIDARAFDHRPLHLGQEVGGVHAGEPTVAAPDRRPHRFHHYDVAHVMTAWFAGMGTSR